MRSASAASIEADRVLKAPIRLLSVISSLGALFVKVVPRQLLPLGPNRYWGLGLHIVSVRRGLRHRMLQRGLGLDGVPEPTTTANPAPGSLPERYGIHPLGPPALEIVSSFSPSTSSSLLPFRKVLFQRYISFPLLSFPRRHFHRPHPSSRGNQFHIPHIPPPPPSPRHGSAPLLRFEAETSLSRPSHKFPKSSPGPASAACSPDSSAVKRAPYRRSAHPCTGRTY